MKIRSVLIMMALMSLSLTGIFGGNSAHAQSQQFIVVLDAGHGGHDPGTVGSKTSNREKDINLAITLGIGRLLKANCPDVKVIYTRDDDFFVTLGGRADIANKAKADLFVSIHTNSIPETSKSTPMGVQAYTLTLRTAAENLAVEKRENSVIQFEADGAQKYGFANANSSESDIMFELMQDRDMKESVEFATLAQNEMVKTGGRKDMGVLQANLAVLRLTYMPSVLIEVGFICTPAEERFLMSDEGRQILAKCIFNAIVTYKAKHTGRMSNLEKITPEEQEIANNAGLETTEGQPQQEDNAKTGTQTTAPAQEATEPKPVDETLFKVQLFTSQTILKNNAPQLKGCTAEYYIDSGTYKYTYGSTSDYSEAQRLRKQIAEKFPDCFIIAIKDGKRVDTQTAIQEWKQKKK